MLCKLERIGNNSSEKGQTACSVYFFRDLLPWRGRLLLCLALTWRKHATSPSYHYPWSMVKQMAFSGWKPEAFSGTPLAKPSHSQHLHSCHRCADDGVFQTSLNPVAEKIPEQAGTLLSLDYIQTLVTSWIILSL